MKKFLLLLTVFVTSLKMMGQEEPAKNGFHKENIFVGGNFGASFGNYTIIDVSPQAGYRLNRYVAAGAGINGQYISLKEHDEYGQLYRRVQQGVVGMNLFGRVYPIRQFMVQVQPEANYIFGKQIFYQPVKQTFRLDAAIVPSLLVGGGIVLPAEGGAFIMALFYDVWHNANSPYGRQPILHVGYNYNLQ